MRAQLLVLHRKENYPGEHAPEILEVVDELTLEENPQYWVRKVREVKDSIGEGASSWALVTIDLDDGGLMDALYPRTSVRVLGMVADGSPGSQSERNPSSQDRPSASLAPLAPAAGGLSSDGEQK